jgi:hypothetical protein
MVSHFTNGRTHTSPEITYTTTCGNSYTISGTAPTSPTYLTHLSTSVYAQLNTYTTNYNSLCPVNDYKISTTSGGSTSVSGLTQPDANRRIYPSTTGQHVKITYYAKISAEGGKTSWFGPYYIDIGCTPTSVYSFSDNSFDTTANTKYVNEDLNIYGWTFTNPSISMRTGVSSYCSVIKNEVKDTSGNTHTRMDSCTS